MRKKIHSSLLGSAIVAFACVVYTGCDDSSSAIKEPPPNTTPGVDGGNTGSDGGGGFDAGTLPDGAPKDCFDDPKTHFEIINACTNATKLTKNPTLPRLLADGGLPPLE